MFIVSRMSPCTVVVYCFQDVALYCLRTSAVDVNARDNAGYTPLHESCVRGDLIVARELITHGGNVNCCSQDGIRYLVLL